jgi:hypothetical protein
MTTKEIVSIEKLYLEAECEECHGEGWITVGKFDEQETVECLCRKEARAQEKADSQEE